MKIYVLQDGEGTAYVAQWERNMAPDEKLQARHIMTQEINAAVQGAFNGGASEVIVQESHRYIIDKLDSRVKIAVGASAINDSFDAAFVVGQHAMARTMNAVLAHTFCAHGVRTMLLNDIPIGELGWFAATAGLYGVPLVFLSGDRAAVDEGIKLLGDSLVTAVVKEGLGLHAALSLSPESARKLITEKATESLEKKNWPSPYIVSPNPVLTIEYHNPLVAERAMLYPGVERLDITTVRFKAANFEALVKFRLFSALIHGVDFH